MLVEWSYDEQFQEVHRLVGPHALDTTDFTARQDLEGLEAGQRRVRACLVPEPEQRSCDQRAGDRPVRRAAGCRPVGEGRSMGHARSDLRFLWSGDTAGQGWGINPGFGGMKIYEAMRQRSPLFFIHSGDTIYADGPIAESVVGESGQVWNNIVTPQVAKVAETLDEFRGRLPLQPARRERAPLQRRGAADLAVGRSRSDQQLVGFEGPFGRRALQREERAAAHRARRAGVSRVRADATLRCARIAARLPTLQLRPAARAVRARHAVVPRSQFGQPADHAQRRRRRSSVASSWIG